MKEVTNEFLTTLPENISKLQKLEGYCIPNYTIEKHTGGIKKEHVEPAFNILMVFANSELKKQYGATINSFKRKKFVAWYKATKPAVLLSTGNQIVDWLLYARVLEPIPDSHRLTINEALMNDVYLSAKYNIATHRVETRITKTTTGTPLKNADLKKICDAYITKQEFINMGLIGHTETFYLR
jgi:hypothetical protein